jgi:RNA polymerase sigma-70 factor (ECF subfamily)
MQGQAWLAERFETHRARLRGLAFRMLGSQVEAEDAVQETWLRLSRSEADDLDNLGGWLTTVAARICLDMLRARAARKEEPLDTHDVPRIEPRRLGDPESEALTADAVGLALLVVLDRLTPAERVAFVLHDTFGIPFNEIAPIVGRTPVAAKKLASRARARVRGGRAPDTDLARRRQVVEAYLAASREGDLNALLALLDPEVVRRADRWAIPADAPAQLRGANEVASGTLLYARTAAHFARAALIDGNPGLVVAPHGRLRIALTFVIEGDRIVLIDVIADPHRLDSLTITL